MASLVLSELSLIFMLFTLIWPHVNIDNLRYLEISVFLSINSQSVTSLCMDMYKSSIIFLFVFELFLLSLL